VFPFSNTEGNNFDYIDIKYLSGKNVILAAEWDVPVKIGKETRSDDIFGVVDGTPELDVINRNYYTTVDSITTVLKQLYYADADKFFEHAT